MIRSSLAPLMLLAHRLAQRPYPPGAFRILLLHDIAPHQEAALDRLLERIGERFGFMNPDEAGPRLAMTERDFSQPVLISFDDGFVSNFHVAEKILARHKAKALFFVCPGLMDLPKAERRAAVAGRIFQGRLGEADLPDHLDLMDWEQAGALAAAGHVIGGHSSSHRRLAGLAPADLDAEVAGAALRLKEKLGRADWFAYPFGDIDSIDRPALEVIGRHFRFCRSGVRGANAAGIAPLGLLAEQVDLDSTPVYRRLALEGGLDFRYVAARERLAALCQGLAAPLG